MILPTTEDLFKGENREQMLCILSCKCYRHISHISNLLYRGPIRALEVESIANNQLFNQSCLCNKAFIKTHKNRLWRASGLVNMWRFGESGPCGEGMEALGPLPIPCPMHLYPLSYPFIIN